jgi:hypothetical protein
MHRKFKQRNSKGLTTIALVLVIAFCGILPLGLLGFEIVRFFVIQEELRNITDSAALAGTAAMASAPSAPATFPSPNQSHAWTYEDREAVAVSVAAFTFTQNTIIEQQFGLPGGSPVLSYTDAQGFTVPVTAVASAPNNLNVLIDPQPPMPQTPAIYSASLNICLYFTPPGGGGPTVQVAMGQPATSIQVQAYYSDRPLFLGRPTGGWNFGVANMGGGFTCSAFSNGGLPSIDLMLAFDTSGSMDDQTAVVFVNRFWTGAGNGSPAGNPFKNSGLPVHQMRWRVTGSNTLFGVIGPPSSGSGLNVFFPQNLDYAAWPTGTDPEGHTVGNLYPQLFSEFPGSYPSTASQALATNGLRCNTQKPSTGGATMPEQSQPPGNAVVLPLNLDANTGPGNNLNPLIAIGAPSGPMFTDMVVLPSTVVGTVTTPTTVALGDGGGTNNFSPSAVVTNGGTTFTFTNVAQLVEASRGNLESNATLTAATMGQYTSSLLGYTPTAGTYNAYWLWVMQAATPISPAVTAAYDFFQTMHLSANSHFGLVTFAGTSASLGGGGSGTVGSGQTETIGPFPNISQNYLSASYQSSFPFPCVAVNQATDNYNTITTSFVPLAVTSFSAPVIAASIPLQPTTQTDIADALTNSITIMSDTTKTRATAKKAIILFTDGVPTGDDAHPANNYHENEGYADAIAAATTAGGLSPAPIPIYTIGLSQNASILPQEDALLGDGLPAPPTHPTAYPRGIAWDSDANVARYYSVVNPQNIEEAFQQIARSLCVIQ